MADPTSQPAANAAPINSPTAIGKRYQCDVCQTMVLCLRPAKVLYQCCGQAMQEVRMQKLPSGD